MTTHDDFDRRLTAWLEATAPAREPESLAERVLARTAATRRRPAWAILERWTPVTSMTSQTARLGRAPWRSFAVAAALTALLLAGALLIAGSRREPLPAPFGPAANGMILASMDGDIVALDSVGAEPRVLVGGPTDDFWPWFAHDGSRFAFVRGDPEAATAELWLADADGSDTRSLADIPPDAWVEWAPDGTAIAMSHPQDSAVTFIPTDGGEPVRVETGLQRVDRAMFRPPDGAAVTFRGLDQEGRWGIYLMARDGSSLVHLALDAGFTEDEYYDVNWDYYFNDPIWDPTGQTLAFHTLEPDPGAPAGPGFRIHLASVETDGTVTNERTLEFDPAMDDEYSPAFLPDGQGFVYQSLEGTEHRLWQVGVAPGSTPRDLGFTSTDWTIGMPSPDGTQVLAARNDGGVKRPVAIDLRSLGTTELQVNDDVTWQRRGE